MEKIQKLLLLLFKRLFKSVCRWRKWTREQKKSTRSCWTDSPPPTEVSGSWAPCPNAFGPLSLVFLTLSSTSLSLSRVSQLLWAAFDCQLLMLRPRASIRMGQLTSCRSLSSAAFSLYTHTYIVCLSVCRKRKKGAVLAGLVIDRLEANQSASTPNLQPENLGWPMEGDPKRRGISTLEAPPSSFAAMYTHTHTLYTLPLHPTEHRPASGPLVYTGNFNFCWKSNWQIILRVKWISIGNCQVKCNKNFALFVDSPQKWHGIITG
jgi:hypothetical protein